MTEEPFSLPLNDGHTLYGLVNRAAEPARRAVVLCHGLTGHMHEQQFHAAKRFFTARGYDVIRFNFYGEEDDARRTTDCTVALHARDLAVVLAHFAPQYKRLYAAGHSYGGLALLMANPQDIAAASLWDGTFIPVEDGEIWMKYWQYNAELGEHLIAWPPTTQVIGRKFYEETVALTREKLYPFARNFSKPAQVLAAGDSPLNLPNQKKLFEMLECGKAFHAIEGAGHCFNEGDTVLELLEKTYEWFERH